MKKISRKDIDTFGVLIGVIIGIILGFLISSKISISEESEMTDDVILNDNKEYIYLLQLGRFTDSKSCENFINELNNKEVDHVYVLDNGIYFIYSYISTDYSKISMKLEAFTLIGYNGLIKKEYIKDRLNVIQTNEINDKYIFFDYVINSLIKSINNEEISENYEIFNNPYDLELLSWINMLKTINNETYKERIELQAYKMIVEKIK